MKLYWFTTNDKEYITYKETDTKVYDTEKQEWLLFGTWQKIELKEWLEAIKQEWRYLTLDTKRLLNLNK